MTEATLQRLATRLERDEAFRTRMLNDPIGTLEYENVRGDEIARALVAILNGDLRIDASNAQRTDTRTPWPPTGTQTELRLTGITPGTASVDDEFPFLVTGEDFHECDVVIFWVDGARPYPAYGVAMDANGSLAGKALIKRPGTYTVIVGSKDRWGRLVNMLVVS
jgi:hypothetical protein